MAWPMIYWTYIASLHGIETADVLQMQSIRKNMIPSGNCDIATEHGHRNSGFTHG